MSATREQIIRLVYESSQAIAAARKAADELIAIDKKVNDAAVSGTRKRLENHEQALSKIQRLEKQLSDVTTKFGTQLVENQKKWASVQAEERKKAVEKIGQIERQLADLQTKTARQQGDARKKQAAEEASDKTKKSADAWNTMVKHAVDGNGKIEQSTKKAAAEGRKAWAQGIRTIQETANAGKVAWAAGLGQIKEKNDKEQELAAETANALAQSHAETIEKQKAADRQYDQWYEEHAKQAANAAAEAKQQSVKRATQIEAAAAAYRKDLNTEVNNLLKQHSKDEVTQTREASREKAHAEQKAAKDRTDTERAEARKRREIEELENKWIRREYRDRINYQKGLIEEHNKEVKKAQDQAKAWVTAFAGLTGINSIVDGAKALAEHWDKIKRDTIDAVKEVGKYREELLEIAAMRNHMADTTPELVAQLGMRSQTLQTKQDALSMTAAAEGAGQAAVGQNITRDAADELLVGAGQLQTMEHSDPRAYGKLSGQLMLEAEKGTTGKELKARLAKLYEIQQPGGFENMGQFAKQYADVSGFVQNDIYTRDEVAALLSGLSLSGSETAATRLEQITRLTSSGLMRNRKMKGAPGIEMDTSAEYFKKLDITPGMRSMERLNRIADDLIKEQDAAEKAHKPFLVSEYTQAHGIHNVDDAQALMDYAGLRKKGCNRAHASDYAAFLGFFFPEPA